MFEKEKYKRNDVSFFRKWSVQFLRKFDKFSRPSSVSQRGTLCCTRCHRISAHASTTKQTIKMKFNKLFYIGTDVQFSPENSVAGAFIRNIVTSVPSPLIRFPSGSHPGQTRTLQLYPRGIYPFSLSIS